MRCVSHLVARRRAEDAYRLHYVYGFSWASIAAQFKYRSAASAERCASRFKGSALAMFYREPPFPVADVLYEAAPAPSSVLLVS